MFHEYLQRIVSCLRNCQDLESRMRSTRTYSVSCGACGIVDALESAMCFHEDLQLSFVACGIVGALESRMCFHEDLQLSFVACGIVGALESRMSHMVTYSYRTVPDELSALLSLWCVPLGYSL